jgi:hypothetical protein
MFGSCRYTYRRLPYVFGVALHPKSCTLIYTSRGLNAIQPSNTPIPSFYAEPPSAEMWKEAFRGEQYRIESRHWFVAGGDLSKTRWSLGLQSWAKWPTYVVQFWSFFFTFVIYFVFIFYNEKLCWHIAYPPGSSTHQPQILVPQFYKVSTLDPVPRPVRSENFVTMLHITGGLLTLLS